MNDEPTALLNDECQLLDYGESRTAGFYIKLRLPPDASALEPFRGLDCKTKGHDGHRLRVVIFSEPDVEAGQERKHEETGEQHTKRYGQEARELRLSSFFRTPKVWKCIGTDDEFLEWVRTRHCAYCKRAAPNEAAHVRRIADGAGVGIKPDYAAIPLCHEHHALQHQHGESALGGREQFDKWRMHYIQTWCWETLKAHLGFDSWTEVPPNALYRWAAGHEVANDLPACYLER